MELYGSIEEELDFFLGSRDLTNKLKNYLLSLSNGTEEVLYRGMEFPLHLLKEGTILEEWHQSTHWSKEFNIGLKFAYDGYINEDFAEEIGTDDFVKTVFRLKSNTKGIDTECLVNEFNLEIWKKEREVTFIGVDFLIENVEYINENEKPYYLVDVSEIRV